MQVILKIVDCPPVFKNSHKNVSKMATPYPFVTTEQLCRLTCLLTPKCVSYQINRNPEAAFCSIQTNGDNLETEEWVNYDLVLEYTLVDSCTDKPLDKTTPGLQYINILTLLINHGLIFATFSATQPWTTMCEER